MKVGLLIHKIRKEKKMTLLELSTASGVALATLSRMENGKMTGTLESHMNICKALGVSLPDLYKDLVASTQKVEVRPHGASTDVFIHDKNAGNQICTRVPSSITQLLGRRKNPATLPALRDIRAKKVSRQRAMPAPRVGTTVSRLRK